MIKSREIWIDNVKVIACILVVVGHFTAGLAGIVPRNSVYYWFHQTIYYFHVPLFFICSGYLYQRNSKIDTICAWKNSIIKKLFALGVPYFTFSIATWIMKKLFQGVVNNEARGLIDTLFFHPEAPYWYLYMLFVCFLVTPTMKKSVHMYILILFALIIKLLNISLLQSDIYVINTFMHCYIWFALGILTKYLNLSEIWNKKRAVTAAIGCGIAVIFILSSIYVYRVGIENDGIYFILGVAGCTATILIISCIFKSRKQNRFFALFTKYLMPIYLMHTIFAAGVRGGLLKIGINNGAVHIILGLVASFVLPAITSEIMRHIKGVEFLLYPNKFIKIGK